MKSGSLINIRSLWTMVLILAQLWWVGGVGAAVYPQPPKDTPFTITGFIQSATLDDPTNVLSGGTVTVNGTKVIIPKNTIVLMPGTLLSWQELFAKAPSPWGIGTGPVTNPNQTGLALTDINPSTGKPPLTTYEITINGNCIPSGATTCTSVAGLVAISQQSLNVGQGVINSIDYANGELHVGGALGVSSPTDIRVQINDPKIPGLGGTTAGTGRYSIGLSPDQRFTTDQDNPAIRAKTGYPMCIPRAVPPPAVPPLTIPPAETDPLCPQRNRPLDPATLTAPLGNFTIGPAPNSSPPGITPIVAATPHPAGDPTSQAPFQVGDYIDFSGTLQQDATGPYISAHQIVANLGIYTSPGANPAYMALEVTILGVGGFPITFPIDVPQEATGRIKAVGFFTDPTRAVDLFAIDVDPCTGGETERLLLAGIAAQVTPWGRFRDIDRTCPVLGVGCGAPTREWMARFTDATGNPLPPVTAANGLQALQYRIPVAEFIFPENTVYGDPTLLAVPLNFQDFPFLLNGAGPWRTPAGPVVGQLTPFPLTNSIAGLTPQVTTPVSCSPTALKPVANAGANQTVVSAATVTLNGGASSDPNTPPAALTYQWSQTAGPALPGFPVFPSMTSPSSSPTTTFTAPTLQTGAIPVSLTFQLTVTNSFGLISTATTAVSVTPPPPHSDTVVITGATYRARDGSLNVTATSSDTTCGGILTLSLDTGFSATMTKTGPFPAGCNYSYVNRPVFPQPSSVTVKSSLGGSATTTQIRLK